MRAGILGRFTAARFGCGRFVVPETGADSRRGHNFTAAGFELEPRTVDGQLQGCLKQLDGADAAGSGPFARPEPKLHYADTG